VFHYKPISLSHNKETSLSHHVCYLHSSPSTTSQIAWTHKIKLHSFFFFVYITNIYHPIILFHFMVSLHHLSSSNFIRKFWNILLLLCPFWILLWKYICSAFLPFVLFTLLQTTFLKNIFSHLLLQIARFLHHSSQGRRACCCYHHFL